LVNGVSRTATTYQLHFTTKPFGFGNQNNTQPNYTTVKYMTVLYITMGMLYFEIAIGMVFGIGVWLCYKIATVGNTKHKESIAN